LAGLNMITWFHKHYSIIDLINLVFIGVLIIIFLFVVNRTPHILELIFIFFSSLGLIFLIGWVRNRKIASGWKKIIMSLYPVILLLGVFEVLHLMLPYFNPYRFDTLMAKFDFSLFGCYLNVWFEQWAHPFLTEIMYLCYISYYFLFFIVLGWLYKNKMNKEIEQAILYFLVCFYGGYLLYFFVPVSGPRFFLADLQTIDLHGYFFAGPVREFIDFLEPNKLDAFPSLHTATLMTTLFVTYLNNKKMFYYFLPFAVGIIISIFYCRYHYFIDFIAGLIWAIIAYWIGHIVYYKYHAKFIFHFKE
jgi:membrane-associated phospholipid phosphatase